MNASKYYSNVLLPLIVSSAMSAMDWDRRGNVFDPEVQIIVGNDDDSQEAARLTLERFGARVMAVHVEIGLFVSMELVFSPLANDPAGFYNALPNKLPKPTNVFRCADERIPADFSGYLHIPSGAKSWASLLPVAQCAPMGPPNARKHVSGGFEVYGATFRDRRAAIYCNAVGKLVGLPWNPLATAFAAGHRPDLKSLLVGDVLLTFGECCERRDGAGHSGGDR